VFQVAMVVAAALALATLFTAWTPGQTNPSLRELFFSATGLPATPGAQETAVAQSLLPSPTFPPGAPTPTLRNPNLIGIVAGHWKNDSGAVCADGLTEAAVNLEIASRVQKQLVEAGYDVDLLSEFDPALNGYQAAALVSIHNDSCEFINEEATGFKVAAAMATHQPEQAAGLTACLRARYGAVTQLPLHSTSVTRDMTSYHAFNEIHDTTPAAIIETGFLNRDRQLLTQRPDVVAFGVASGILCYLKNEPISSPTPNTTGTAPATAAPPTPVLPFTPTSNPATPTGITP
jgi:N-acetylmuramoyl-L-alanine amidase